MVREDLKTKDIYDTTDCLVSRERTVPEMGYLVTAHGAGVRTKASPHLRGRSSGVEHPVHSWWGFIHPLTHLSMAGSEGKRGRLLL